jgi:hypothetical protein
MAGSCTTNEVESRTDKVFDSKEVAYYAASITAWFSTKLEYDKSFLTLSTAGLGLLLTLLATNVGQGTGETLTKLYVLAIVAFSITIGCVLVILSQNAKQIELVLNADPENPDSAKHLYLTDLDKFTAISFAVAIFCTAWISVEVVLSSDTGKKMTTDKSNKPTPTKDSFAEMRKLQELNKSFQGMHQIQPGAAAPKQPPASAPKTLSPAPVPANNGVVDTGKKE